MPGHPLVLYAGLFVALIVAGHLAWNESDDGDGDGHDGSGPTNLGIAEAYMKKEDGSPANRLRYASMALAHYQIASEKTGGLEEEMREARKKQKDSIRDMMQKA